MSTLRNIYLTNNSSITLHANYSEGDAITLSDPSTIASGATNVLIAQWNCGDHTDDYGWIDLGRSNSDRTYQIYFERTREGYDFYATLSHYDASRKESLNDPSKFSSADVGSGQYNQPHYYYTFNGKTAKPHWQLKSTLTGAQEWQHMHPPATTWGALSQHTCSLEIDQETTKVILQITNACGQNFYLTGQQNSGGSDSWSEVLVPNGTTWTREFAVNMATNDTWEFTVTGYYDPPSTGDRRVLPAIFGGGRRELPDPTFKIKRVPTTYFAP